MAEYMNKELFLSYMGLTGDETKYGNRDAEHQHRRYSTYMSYEIMGCVDDSIVEEELVPVVRCYECKHYTKSMMLCDHEGGLDTPDKMDFCSYGERKEADG